MKHISFTCDYGTCGKPIESDDSKITIEAPGEVLHFHSSCWKVARGLIESPNEVQTTF